MGWIKLDDAFLDHPKYLKAGPLGGFLCIAAIAWSNRNRTDGLIPRSQVRRLVDFEGFAHHMWMGEVMGGGDDVDAVELAGELVEIGLWEREGRDFRIHDYHDWQRSTEEIDAAIEQRRQAGRVGGRARAASVSSNGSSSGSSSAPLNGSSTETPSGTLSESPSRSKKEEERKKTPQTPQGASSPSPVQKAQANGFDEWLLDHATVTGDKPPKSSTKAYAHLAEMFNGRTDDGLSLSDLKLATRGAFNDEFRKANGHYGAESVLRPTKTIKLVNAGRRFDSQRTEPTYMDRFRLDQQRRQAEREREEQGA